MTAAPLVETKLHVPRRRRGIVRRPRLTSRLGGRELPVLTVVSAPAGFGKTTLLAEWLGADAATAWLALDGRDNDPALFWSYVVGALQTVVPAVGETALSLLRSASSAEAALGTLVNDLAAVDQDV